MRQMFTCMAILVIACSDPMRPLELGPADVVAVTVHLAIGAMQTGDTASLVVIARAADGRTTTNLPVAFRSSDDSIVAVSSDGIVSALKAGEALITATIGSSSGTLTIPVYVTGDACGGCWDY